MSSNPTVQTTGWWLWKKKLVTHAGGTSVFSGNAQVAETDSSLCVTEPGLLKEQTTCFLKTKSDESHGGLPDGELAGRSKRVALTLSNGEVKEFASSLLGLYSASKEGGDVVVKKAGLFGETEVERIPADQVAAIEADHCKVCEAVNPLFNK